MIQSRTVLSLLLLFAAAIPAWAQTVVVASVALLPDAVSGLQKTDASAKTLPVSGQPFPAFLRVTLAKPAPAANDTQILLPLTEPLKKGDTLQTTLWMRGKKTDGTPAEANLFVIRNAPPWSNFGTAKLKGISGKPNEWRRVSLAFAAPDDFAANAAVVAIHLAYGAQTVDIGGLKIINHGAGVSPEDVMTMDVMLEPARTVTVAVNRNDVRQTMTGFGGNFVSFGGTEASDGVDKYIRQNLRVDHARVGVVFRSFLKNDGSLDRANPLFGGVFDLMKQLQVKKTPIVASIWNLPDSFVTNPEAQNQRRIKSDKRDAVIATLVEWLRIARDDYGVTVPEVSFNEADGGYSIILSPEEARYFIIKGGEAFRKAGLPTKWLLGDTANGGGFPKYAEAIASDPATAPYLGAASFHGWDVLSASDDSYRAIATLAKKYNKPVWCLEAGFDAQLWNKKPPVWDKWDTALHVAEAYARYLTFAEASVVDYWQYRNDYPIVGGADKSKPYSTYRVIEMYTEAFVPGTKIVATTGGADGLYMVAGLAPKTGKLRVVLVNTGGKTKIALNPTRRTAAFAATIRTQNGEYSGTSTQPVITFDAAGQVTMLLPPRSVAMLTER